MLLTLGKGSAIMVLGVAGVGKTSFGKILSSHLGVAFIDVPELVVKKRLYSSYDSKAQAYVVDLRKLSIAVGSELRGRRGVVASIYAFKPRGVEVELAIVLRMKPTKLIEVLRQRKYPIDKIRENASAELIDQPLIEAIRKFGEERVIQIDVTGRKLDEVAREAAEKIRRGETCSMNQQIDWIRVLEESGELEELLRFLESEKESF